MLILRNATTLALLAATVTLPAPLLAQHYPTKPVRIVTGSAGSGNDIASRILAQGLTGSLGQQVIVENRAAGVVTFTTVSKAPADGYTLLYYTNGMWTTPLLEKTPWDPIRDFAPVIATCNAPSILVVHPAVPAKSVKELIALAKAKPGALNYAAAGLGSGTQLSAELFKSMAGVNIVYIPYKGSGLALIDLIGGQVQMMFATAGSVATHLKSGSLRALAITSAQPSQLLPGLPTIAASGVPGYESVSIYGVFAPARTPTAIIDRLNKEILALLNRPEIREKFMNSGVEVTGSTPGQLVAIVKSEMARLGKVIKDAGIRAQP
jgi:tripartite-type tricarboxylate transporter receptor subunit TctC